jgi:hypothetical protein
MEDLHNLAHRAAEALAAAVSVEAEKQSTGGGPVPCGSTTPQVATLSPEPAVGGRDRHPREPLTYPTHHTRGAQRAATAAKRMEHQDPPRPTKRGRI